MPKNPNFPRPVQPPVILRPVRKIKKAASFVRVLNALWPQYSTRRIRHISIDRLLGSLPRHEINDVLRKVA